MYLSVICNVKLLQNNNVLLTLLFILLRTKLYKVAWNVSANNSETVYHTDMRLGEVVYVLAFYNILFSWLFPLNGFEFTLFYGVAVKTDS